ncbi:hypothetical protein LXH13_14760 [Streptomyces spinosirectus]|jgi:hypothetical protein|uniref:hypothetical protein n=1 Tax=Streptomyces TaxID=1883 RepID=UPI000D381C05|nr:MULTISPECIES: hypothetical protein [Streptomyces]MBY8345020.1 hypothetical protein [Streptomyces plumbidurans]PTM88295.1 hypothetical protein C7821_114113 [Streptomyces sp. VMFN-G11Ma]UIR18225.1 hypothetical protein LXH13_14760 [Streptomyces spinosirectus]
MTAEHDGTDALMAALTGEELSREARADAAFMSEHREAEADVALLREQLGLIGDALARDETVRHTPPAPVRAPRDWRRARRFALGSLAVAAAATVLAGMGWLLTQSGTGASEGADASAGKAAAPSASSALSSPGYLACAGLIVEGDVTAVEQVPSMAGQERITLHVTRSYKPQKGPKQVVFVLDQGLTDKALHKGDHLLVTLPQHSDAAQSVVVGAQAVARERAGLIRALPQAAGLRCGG